MSVIPIYNCFHPILKKKTTLITDIDDDLVKFANDMFDTMYNADGIGLAANQVGKSVSLLVLDTNMIKQDKPGQKIAMINPEILSYSDEEVDYQEGCLSIPKFYEDVSRPSVIDVLYWDLDGNEHRITCDDILARVSQHEIDHLNGILFYERLSPIKRTLSKGKLRKIEKGDYEHNYPMIMPNGTFIESND